MREGTGRPPRSRATALAELEALENDRSVLWSALETEHDPGARALVLSQLSENRSAIARVRDELNLDNPDTPEVHTSRSFIVDTADHDIDAELARYAPPTSGPLRHSTTDGQTLRRQAAQQQQRRPSGPRPPVGFEQEQRGGNPLRWLLLFLGGALVGLAAVWFVTNQPFSGDETAASDGIVDDGDSTSRVGAIEGVLEGMGLGNVVVEERDGAIFLIGSAPSEESRSAAIGAATALADGAALDSTAFVVGGAAATEGEGEVAAGAGQGRPEALQSELDRIVAATPIIFESNQVELSELHQRVLNNVAMTMAAYPGLTVRIVGFTDGSGTDEANRQVSLSRAESVKAYLVDQGIGEGGLVTDAMGETTSTGSAAIANLERRVEFEVVSVGAVPAPTDGSVLRVAIVAPSAANDLAFTQSMVDAVNVIAAERGNVEVTVTDNTFVQEEAAQAIRDYASQGYDLVIAHGSQFGGELPNIATEFPNVAFAWGTANDTFDLPNVYAYDAAAEEGGYLLGAMSARLSQTGVIGVVGPIEVGDAQRYVNGFKLGAESEIPGTDVLVTYTQSFSDLSLAAEAAEAHVAADADVMTGTAQMVVGAISVANENNVLWFGTQSNQSSLAPDIVGASQVYHWEVILREIVADVDSGTPSGKDYTATLANGGLVIEFNEGVAVPPEVSQRVTELTQQIAGGSLDVNVG